MGSIFRMPKIPEPIMPPPPPSADDVAAREAAAREAEGLRKRRRGMAGTIMTGPQGLTTEPTVLKQKLGE